MHEVVFINSWWHAIWYVNFNIDSFSFKTFFIFFSRCFPKISKQISVEKKVELQNSILVITYLDCIFSFGYLISPFPLEIGIWDSTHVSFFCIFINWKLKLLVNESWIYNMRMVARKMSCMSISIWQFKCLISVKSERGKIELLLEDRMELWWK